MKTCFLSTISCLMIAALISSYTLAQTDAQEETRPQWSPDARAAPIGPCSFKGQKYHYAASVCECPTLRKQISKTNEETAERDKPNFTVEAIRLRCQPDGQWGIDEACLKIEFQDKGAARDFFLSALQASPNCY